MTEKKTLIHIASSKLPAATYQSPDFIDVPIPNQVPIAFTNIDILPEEITTTFDVFRFRKILILRRELNGRFIEEGYEYILN